MTDPIDVSTGVSVRIAAAEAPSAQVQHDQPQLVQRPTEVAGRLVRDILVTDAVHAVATDVLVGSQFPVECVHRGGGRPAKKAVSKTATWASPG